MLTTATPTPFIAPSSCQILPQHGALTPTIGIDEVGRGCLFGQMTVAAVILPPNMPSLLADLSTDSLFFGLKDSKKLTKTRRDVFYELILQHASYAIIDVAPSIIDAINIHHAALLGMHSAGLALTQNGALPALWQIDGKFLPRNLPQNATATAIVQGDNSHVAIALASVLAKVWRDRAMVELADTYPHYGAYGLAQHKGYGTKQHREMILKLGISDLHRKSFRLISERHINKTDNAAATKTTITTPQRVPNQIHLMH